jgi:tyrosinase
VTNTVERRDVYSFPGAWDPVLRAYALAVGVLRGKPDTEPVSWGYQAAIHGVGAPTDPPPDDFRSQCQHNCWYFLPWHRWYLYYFEQILRSVMTGIAEIPTGMAEAWALPYWNYARIGAQKIPAEFAAQTLWDGRPNPLFDATRAPGVNERTVGLDPRVTAPLPGVLTTQPFTSAHSGVATFAGTASHWHHFREPGSVAGGLEATPHNDVHGFVLGDMGDFATAGLDPLFWLHHCNIDRYWEIRGHDADPTVTWSNIKFKFHDTTPTPREVTADGCVDTVAQLGYRYDDTSPPAPPTPGHALRSQRIAMVAAVPPPDLPPEVVASHGPLRLVGASVEAILAAGEVSAQFRTARGGDGQPRRVFLTVEDIRGERNPGISYGVYLNEVADQTLAGLISFFGIEGTRQGDHALGYTFDVTDIVQALRDEDAWDPADIHVLFEPIGGVYDEPAPPPEAHSVEVGTFSIAYQ